MADRMFNQEFNTLEMRPVSLWGTITFGSTGAVSSSSGQGITSIVRDDVGKYTITFDDKYNDLLHYTDKILEADDTDPTSVGMQTRLLSAGISSSTPTIVIQFYDFTDGSAADPADGSALYFQAMMRNSSVS